MIGRGAIRNPWIFHQIRQAQNGETPFIPKGHDVLNYLKDLYETVRPQSSRTFACAEDEEILQLHWDWD